MKKGTSIAVSVIAVLLVLLLVTGGALYFVLTAETAPELRQEGTKDVIADMVKGVVTGDEVTVPAETINGLIHRVSLEDRKGLDGVQFTGENHLALWCEHKMLGRTCDVRLDASLQFDESNGSVICKVIGLHVGKMPLPEGMIPDILQRELAGADMRGVTLLEDGSMVVDINNIVREEMQMQSETNVIRNVRCDLDAMYITLYSARDFWDGLFGGK